MKKMMNNIGSKKIDTNTPTLSFPLIDKLSGVVAIHEEALCGAVKHEMLNCLETHEPGIVQAGGSSKYPLALKLYYTVQDNVAYLKGPHLLLQVTGKNNPKRHIRFEYNPSHVTAAGEKYLNEKFFEIMGLTFYEFLAHARFTRIDFCRNISGCDLEDFLIKAKWSKVSQNVFGKDGVLGTMYFGKAGSNQIIAYNKAKELYGDAATEPMVRIETRNRIKLKAKALLDFKNPFERVQLYSLACKNPPVKIGHWLAFQDSCRLRGVGNAIKKQPVIDRAALKKVLSSQPVSWWDIPPDDWKTLLYAALKNAGLSNLPDNPPPFCMAYLVGQAA